APALLPCSRFANNKTIIRLAGEGPPAVCGDAPWSRDHELVATGELHRCPRRTSSCRDAYPHAADGRALGGPKVWLKQPGYRGDRSLEWHSAPSGCRVGRCEQLCKVSTLPLRGA